MLRFAQGLVVHQPDDLTPTASRRYTLNTFFLMNSILVEAQRVVEGLGRHFKDSSNYRRLALAMHAPKLRDVVARFRPARNWTVFHFDNEGAQTALKIGYFVDPPQFVPFLCGHGTRDFDIQCDLADQVALELIIRDEERDDPKAAFDVWLSTASKASTDLLRALDEFLAGTAKEFGAEERQSLQS